MNRRGFLGAILAAGAAPWVAKAGVLMPVRTLIAPTTTVFAPLTATAVNASQRRMVEMLFPDDEYWNRMVVSMAERMRLTRDIIAYGVIRG